VKKAFGGSSLLTAGCHALDSLLMLMDAPVEEVTSYSTRSRNRTFSPYEYDTTQVTILKFKGGKVGKVASLIDCLQPYYFHTHLVGSEGSLLDTKFYSRKLKGLDKSRWSPLATHPIDSGDVKDHPYQPQFQPSWTPPGPAGRCRSRISTPRSRPIASSMRPICRPNAAGRSGWQNSNRGMGIWNGELEDLGE
jgi:predicted dehydrogenase